MNHKIELLPNTILGKTYLQTAIEAFLIDRRAQNFARGTLVFYSHTLKAFTDFAESRALKAIEDITPGDIKEFMLHLEQSGHTPGGVHCAFRAVKTFLIWFENEFEPDNWKNPIKKTKPPKLAIEPIQGVDITEFDYLLSACTGRAFTAIRDKALFYFMLDTGARARELLSIDLSDCEFTSGRVMIRQGKGRKPRIIYFGKRTRKTIREYLKSRTDSNPALWISDDGERLGYTGLRLLIRRRAKKAGIEPPSPHDFRRGFALAYLRAGGDIFTLQKLMGHSDIQVLRRYLAQTDTDTQEGHSRYGPVDRL